jgi:hypothetical protein
MNTRVVEPELMDREGSTIDPATSNALARVELDSQVATARGYPRSVAAFMKEAKALVTLDVDTAEACIFALPRGKDPRTGKPKIISGASVRFAEIIMHSFGNNRAGARVIAESREFITAQGVYRDLEKNSEVTVDVQRRITDKYNKRYNSDMIGVTGNAACSVALRNAILRGVPKALWMPLYEAARQVAVGDETTLAVRRDRAVAIFAKLGISVELICERLGIEGIADIGLDELEVLTGIRTSIREGTVTAEQAFTPEPESKVGVATERGNVKELDEHLRQRGTGTKNKADPKKPPSVFDKHVAAMSAAADLDGLNEAYEATKDPDSALTDAERAELVEVYTRRENALKNVS